MNAILKLAIAISLGAGAFFLLRRNETAGNATANPQTASEAILSPSNGAIQSNESQGRPAVDALPETQFEVINAKPLVKEPLICCFGTRIDERNGIQREFLAL